MTPVCDKKIDVTSPGAASRRHWGSTVASAVPLAGGDWLSALQGAEEGAAPPVAAVSEFDYEVETKPLRWRLERTSSGFIASDLPTGIFGFGSDPNNAIHDLFVALAEHRDVLERQEALSPGLQDQLAYLRELL